MKALLKRALAPMVLAICGCGVVPVVGEEEIARERELWQSHTQAGLAAARERKFEAAEKEFLAAVAAITVISGNESRLVAGLNHLGLLYQAGGKRDAAEETLRKALAFAEKALGAEHEDTAMTLGNLAFAVRDYAAAEPLFERSMRIYEKTLGAENPDYAVRLDGLARVYGARRAWDKAEALLVRAAAIFEKALGPDHPNVAAVLQNLAGVCEEQGQYARAEGLYRRSLAIWEKSMGKDHAAVADCHGRISRVVARGRP